MTPNQNNAYTPANIAVPVDGSKSYCDSVVVVADDPLPLLVGCQEHIAQRFPTSRGILEIASLPVSFTPIAFFHFLLPSVLCHQFGTFWPKRTDFSDHPLCASLFVFVGVVVAVVEAYFDCCSRWCRYDGCSCGHFPDLSKNHSICPLCASLLDVGAVTVLVGSDGSCCGCGVSLNLEMFSDIEQAWDY